MYVYVGIQTTGKKRVKRNWLPVLLEDDAGCAKLSTRCAGAVARCQGVEINYPVLVLMSRGWGGRHVIRRCARDPCSSRVHNLP